MKDLYFAAPGLIGKYSQPLADFLQLTTLPYHAHQIVHAFTFYHLVCTYVAPRVSALLFPNAYPNFSERTRYNWNVHFTSMVQACFINTLALSVMFTDTERWRMGPQERVWGYTGATGMVQGFAAGYFVWDVMISIRRFDVHGPGSLMHALSALAVSSLGFRPFVNYYGLNFILYELSTPFLNIHWFIDKLGYTGGTFQLLNGAALLVSFGGSRLVWGSYSSIRMYQDVWKAISTPSAELPVPTWLAMSYLGANTVLSILNFYWFGRMIQVLRSRFDKPKERKDQKSE